MENIWKKHLDGIVPYKPGKPIEEVKRELGLEKVIKLASNESPLPPSPKVIKAIEETASKVNRYPDGGCYYLKKALSNKLGVSADEIVFGNGSDEIILMALKALVAPGDDVVVAAPTFQIYHIASMIEGAKVNVVPSKNYKYDLDGMLEAVTPKTKVIFIANPDNPTGTYITENELSRFLERVPDDVLVFLDEAYYEFAKGEDYPESLKYLKNTNKKIVIARTFSKAYSLAGLRIGYGITSKDFADVLNKVREPFNVNLVAQAAALAALDDEAYMEKSVSMIKKEMQRYSDFFDSLGINYVKSKANFLLANIGIDSTDVFQGLMKRGIIVRDMVGWGLPKHIRVNVGLEEENNAFFEAFKGVYSDLKV